MVDDEKKRTPPTANYFTGCDYGYAYHVNRGYMMALELESDMVSPVTMVIF